MIFAPAAEGKLAISNETVAMNLATNSNDTLFDDDNLCSREVQSMIKGSVETIDVLQARHTF